MAGTAAAAAFRSRRTGPTRPISPAEYLRPGSIRVVIGEVETTLLELATGQRCRKHSAVLPMAKRAAVRYNPPRQVASDLDALPLPAWDLVDIERTGRHGTAHGYFSLNMVSSRGCPYRCNWCAKPIYGDSYQCRSAQSVAEEMLHREERSFQPDHIWFADDIFALSPQMDARVRRRGGGARARAFRSRCNRAAT